MIPGRALAMEPGLAFDHQGGRLAHQGGRLASLVFAVAGAMVTACVGASDPANTGVTSEGVAPGSSAAVSAHPTSAPVVAPGGGPAPAVEIAVVWSLAGSTRLYLCSLALGTCRAVSAEDSTVRAATLSWSPDGRWLAYGAAELIRVVDAQTGSLRTVLPGMSASYSPDGRILALVTRAGIEVMHAEGGERRLIAASSLDETNPSDEVRHDRILAWSPDATMLASLVTYYEGAAVMVLRVSGGEPVAETDHWSASWSSVPDRMYVAAYDKVATYADDGIFALDLAHVGGRFWRQRLGEAGDGFVRAHGDTLLIGHAEAGTFSTVPEAYRPRGILAARETRGRGKYARPYLVYRRIHRSDQRTVPLSLSDDQRTLLVGVDGAGDVFELLQWIDLSTGRVGMAPLPAPGGKIFAAALRPVAGARPSTDAIDAAWKRSETVELREGELWLPGAPAPASADVVRPLPIPYWPASRPASGTAGTSAPASGVGTHTPAPEPVTAE